MAKILITGGTGLIGKRLVQLCQKQGHKVAVLSRNKTIENHAPVYKWDIANGIIEEGALEGVDCIVHLAGASIGDKRWSKQRKVIIINSRVDGAGLLLSKVKERNISLKVFITASAIGYYGTETTDKVYAESDESGNDFLAEVCRKWEMAADGFSSLGVRIVKVRTGIVLAKEAGALPKMVRPVKMGFGAPLGNGKQNMPWIHIDDLCGIYLKTINDEQMTGAYNAVAPEHISNKEFTRKLAQVLSKPLFMPNVPSFVLRMMFGEMAVILLEGSKIAAKKIMEAGYQFGFRDAKMALKDVLDV